ncbi:unnamed protein product, partial [marine sediment metagenome]
MILMEKKERKPFEDFKVNDRQKEIIKVLIEQSFSTKNLANMYIGALKVLNDESNPDSIHQSAHSLRELVYYMTDHIEVATKIKTHKEQMKQLINQFDELGGIDKEAIVKQWYDLHEYFVDLCHHRSKAQIKDFKENLLKLEYILLSLLGPVYETIEELDRLIGIENPSREDMELVKSLLKKQSHYRYFFKNLHYPNWIDLLVENDFFNTPPQKGDYSVEPLYLTKIADKKYQEVIEIIKKLSNTTHEGAQVEFIKALIKAPIKNTLQLKKAIKRWIASAQSGYFALSKQIILYIKKLFEENEVDIAFEITNAILAIREHQTSENNQTRISYDMNYSIEGYFYGEIIKELHKYISFLLNGFDKALENKINFEWDSIISLCKAVLIGNDAQTDISKEPIFYKENTLRDIKTSIGWLFRKGLSNNNENSIQEILKYVKDYQEPEHSLTFSKIGLGRTLRNIVEKRPNEFTEILPEFLKFSELHKYISFLLNGFDKALENKINFEWDSIISLCKAVLIGN